MEKCFENVFEKNRGSSYPILLEIWDIDRSVSFNNKVDLYILRFSKYFWGDSPRYFINILYK